MEQIDLIPIELLPDGFQISGAEQGQSTGERVRKYRPKEYGAAIALIAEGYSYRGTARATGLHLDTVRAIARDAESEGRIVSAKERIATRLEDFCVLTSERMIEDFDSFKPLQRVIAMGIAAEKMLLLRGQATSITEHRESARISSLDELIDNMRRATPPQTGFEAGAAEQKAVPDAVHGGAEQPRIEASVDDASIGVVS